jgi:hypothetical protein
MSQEKRDEKNKKHREAYKRKKGATITNRNYQWLY